MLFTRHVTSFTAGRKANEIWGSQGSRHGNHCLPAYDAVSISQTIQSRMIGDLEGSGRELIEVLPRPWPEGTGTKYVNTAGQDRRRLGRDSNPAPPEYKSLALPLHQPLRSRRWTVVRTLPSYGRFEGTNCRHLEGTGVGCVAKRGYTYSKPSLIRINWGEVIRIKRYSGLKK
jgi:hypothetical protein